MTISNESGTEKIQSISGNMYSYCKSEISVLEITEGAKLLKLGNEVQDIY